MIPGVSRKQVHNFSLDDCSSAKMVDFLSRENPPRKVAVGIHITTLNALYKGSLKPKYFDVADVIYCDGWSMYILGKIAGLRNIQRIATTDLYPLVIGKLNHPLKVCFLGGDPHLGPLIIAKWKERYPGDSSTFLDGFPSDWQEIFDRINSFSPDVLFLGLGMPLELQLLERYENVLPNGLIISCGGMLRILAGVEGRSPMLMQKLKLEWLYRLTTSPTRTASRYLVGSLNIVRSIIHIARSRMASKH